MQSFKNPLNPSISSIPELFVAILNMVIIIATPIIVFYLILAGFKYVTARGNSERVQEASRALLYGVIGGVVILGAVAILAIIGDVVTSFSTP